MIFVKRNITESHNPFMEIIALNVIMQIVAWGKNFLSTRLEKFLCFLKRIHWETLLQQIDIKSCEFPGVLPLAPIISQSFHHWPLINPADGKSEFIPIKFRKNMILAFYIQKQTHIYLLGIGKQACTYHNLLYVFFLPVSMVSQQNWKWVSLLSPTYPFSLIVLRIEIIVVFGVNVSR